MFPIMLLECWELKNSTCCHCSDSTVISFVGEHLLLKNLEKDKKLIQYFTFYVLQCFRRVHPYTYLD